MMNGLAASSSNCFDRRSRSIRHLWPLGEPRWNCLTAMPYRFAYDAITQGTFGRIKDGHLKPITSDPSWLPRFYDPAVIGGLMLRKVKAVHQIWAIWCVWWLESAHITEIWWAATFLASGHRGTSPSTSPERTWRALRSKPTQPIPLAQPEFLADRSEQCLAERVDLVK